MSRFKKLKPSQIDIDPRFNRDLDEGRAKTIARKIKTDLLGVPVISERENGKLIALDGQHRIAACRMAGFDDLILCEVHDGLSLPDEAALFLGLNSELRRPVRVFDKFKAQLVAKDPVAIEIASITKKHGFRVTKATATCGICAIQALVSTYHRGNLPDVLTVMMAWSEGDKDYLEGILIRALSVFLGKYPTVDLGDFGKRLVPFTADRVVSKLRRMQGAFADVSPTIAACCVFRDIYNARRPRKSQLPPPDAFKDEERDQAAE